MIRTTEKTLSLCKSIKNFDDCIFLIIDKRSNQTKKPIVIEILDSDDENASLQIKSSNKKRKYPFEENNIEKKRKLNSKQIPQLKKDWILNVYGLENKNRYFKLNQEHTLFYKFMTSLISKKLIPQDEITIYQIIKTYFYTHKITPEDIKLLSWFLDDVSLSVSDLNGLIVKEYFNGISKEEESNFNILKMRGGSLL